MSSDSEPLLRIRGLHKSYGPVEVLKGISLDIHRGGRRHRGDMAPSRTRASIPAPESSASTADSSTGSLQRTSSRTSVLLRLRLDC